MAVKLITAIKRYEGTAAEIAAFDLTDIPAGSTFLETDTGIIKGIDQAGALQPKYEQVKKADGHDITLGAKADAAATVADATPFSVVALLKGIWNKLAGILTVQLSGSILANETSKVVTANTDILTDYTALKTMQTSLMVETNTGGVLSLELDGILASLNGGSSLEAGKWYAFDIPVLAASVYNLQFSVGTTLQIKWIGGF